MSKLGWFIGGALAGVAGTIAAAYFLGDDSSSYSSYDDDDECLESSDEAMAFEEVELISEPDSASDNVSDNVSGVATPA